MSERSRAGGQHGHSTDPESRGATSQPVWFGDPARPLFGWLHTPAGGTARAGVVMFPPIGRDYGQSHFALRVLAERLADREIAVFRFDYDGTGNSAGGNADPERLDSWVCSGVEALRYVRALGQFPIALVGMRIGATIAAQVACDEGGVDQLVLWDPATSGRGFLREQRALSSLTFGIRTSYDDGSVETPGMVFGPGAVRDMQRLRLDAFSAPVARRALVLTRPERDPNEALMSGLASEAVDHVEAYGQSALIDLGPPMHQIPYVAVDKIVGWIADATPRSGVRITTPEGTSTAVVRSGQGRSIVEHHVLVPPVGLFGILTEPAGQGSDGPTVVFLSVANEHSIGPNRLWVELARRWAELGVRSIRIDLSGLGESPVRHEGQASFVCGAPEAFEDIEDAVRAVTGENAGGVVLVGVCSGGYQAIDSAFSTKPAGVVAINPAFRFGPPEVANGRPIDPRRVVAMPRADAPPRLRQAVTSSALRRRFPGMRRRLQQLAQPERLGGRTVQAMIGLVWRARFVARPSRRPSRWLPNLVDGGTDVLIVAGELEGRPIRYGASRRLVGRLAETGRFRYVEIPGLQHSLMTAADRTTVTDLATSHLIALMERHGSKVSPL